MNFNTLQSVQCRINVFYHYEVLAEYLRIRIVIIISIINIVFPIALVYVSVTWVTVGQQDEGGVSRL